MPEFGNIYGVEWMGNTYSPTWTRTDLSQSFTPPRPYNINGEQAGSSPFDDLMPWAGMKCVSRAGGAMVEIPKFWYKLESIGTGGLRVQIADAHASGFSTSPAHMDRGDGRGERSAVYVGRYPSVPTLFTSTTDRIPASEIAYGSAAAGCHSVGDNYYLMDFATLFTIWLLYLVEFASWDSGTMIGPGGTDGYARLNGMQSYIPYHTGHFQRTTYDIVEYRYIESLWSNVGSWISGIYAGRDGLYTTLNPENLSDSDKGKLVAMPYSGKYITQFSISSSGGYPMFYPSGGVNGSSVAYSAIKCDYSYGGLSNPYLVSGMTSGKTIPGLFCQKFNASNLYDLVGARLMELP